jgi:hypothetical protein
MSSIIDDQTGRGLGGHSVWWKVSPPTSGVPVPGATDTHLEHLGNELRPLTMARAVAAVIV